MTSGLLAWTARGFHLVGQHIELELLRLVQVQLAADALHHFATHLGHLLGAHRAAVMVAAGAGRQAAHGNGGAEDAHQGFLDPGFHGAVLSWTVLNMTLMVPTDPVDGVSTQFRFISFCFTPRAMPPTSLQHSCECT